MKKSPVRAQRADEAEIAHRSGVPENRVRIILRCNAVPREDEVARLERVFGREDIQEYRAAKVATNAPTGQMMAAVSTNAHYARWWPR